MFTVSGIKVEMEVDTCMGGGVNHVHCSLQAEVEPCPVVPINS